MVRESEQRPSVPERSSVSTRQESKEMGAATKKVKTEKRRKKQEKASEEKLPVYLPIQINGVTVLEKEGEEWKVTNAELKADTGSLAYRATKDLNDTMTETKRGPSWDRCISGEDEGDGWVRTDMLHLHRRCFPGRTRGSLMRFVGSGKATRMPPAYRRGLKQSGTFSCMTGLLRYLSTCSSSPWLGSDQETLHTFALAKCQLEKPSKYIMNCCASLLLTKFTKAYPRLILVRKSIGRYTKS